MTNAPPRCREGHHTLDPGGAKCLKCGKIPRSRANKTDTDNIHDTETDKPATPSPTPTPLATVKSAAISALKTQIAPPLTVPTEVHEVTDPDAIHIADIASPLVISAEIFLAGKLAKKLHKKLDEVTEDDREQPTQALSKWIKIRFPTVRTSPFGEMLMSQILFIATLQARATNLPLSPRPTESAPTASPGTQPATDIVSRAASQSAQSHSVSPTPKEL
jgi:hypothetical protein